MYFATKTKNKGPKLNTINNEQILIFSVYFATDDACSAHENVHVVFNKINIVRKQGILFQHVKTLISFKISESSGDSRKCSNNNNNKKYVIFIHNISITEQLYTLRKFNKCNILY